MKNFKINIRTFGRMELAQQYFPNITKRAAWKKLKLFLNSYPETASLTQLQRRSFTPAEVLTIIQCLGEP